MTVTAEVTSTLNGQSAEIVVMEKPPGGELSYQKKTLNGGTETLIFENLDGGRDKEYKAKIVPSTGDLTQTAEVNYGAEIEIDPIPHRDSDISQKIREDRNFSQGVGAKEFGLGNHSLIGGLMTTALKDEEVLADDGYVYSSVQAAQDAASSWIFIGPGTFNENVNIDTSGLTFQGSGYNTLIDGGSSGHAITLTADNVRFTSFSAQTDTGVGNSLKGIETTTTTNVADNCMVNNVTFRQADGAGIFVENEQNQWIITNCRAENCQNNGIINWSTRGIISNCSADSCGNGISVFEDGVISNSIATNNSKRGIWLYGADNIAIGNRSHNNDDGIMVGGSGVDCIVANNRASNNTTNINDIGTGTLLDGNNTGASN